MPDSPTLFSIRAVSVEHVIPVRRSILLNDPSNPCRFRGDEEPTTLHVAVYDQERIIAIATTCAEPLPGSLSDSTWRLRAVAVEPNARRFGFGRILIKLCLDHAHRHGGRLAWCTARESARGFYEALGFTSSSPPFTLPSRGDLLFYEMHYVLPGNPIIDVE